MIGEINKQIEINSKLINLKHLNWNENLDIKQAAKSVGIFENLPIVKIVE